MSVIWVLISILMSAVLAERARYDKYRVYRILPTNEEQMNLLLAMEDVLDGLDFWSSRRQTLMTVDVMVPPHNLRDFENTIQFLGLENELLIEDVQQAIDKEHSTNYLRKEAYDWTNYYSIQAIYSWLDSMVKEHPSQVSSIIGGSSFEGRKIKGVKVSYKEGNTGVFIEGGIHAKEWIAPATVTYMLNQLLTSTDPDVRDIAENYDWYIFPSVNPDGYEYTRSADRMWRKNRSNFFSKCYGTDLNRNWDFHWMDGGSSNNSCHRKYAGPYPFSEIETRTLSQYITSIADKFQVYLAFHSYTQILLLPYGHSNERISNYDELMKLGNKSMAALARRYGTKYQVGNIVDMLFPASGGSVDWVRGTFNTPITYTYELRDTGKYAFLLPPDQIIPTAEETLDSVVTMLQEARSILPRT